MVIKEKLVWFQELLLLHHQLIRVFVVFHYLIVFHVVIWDSLTTKHYQSVFIDHMKTNKPYTTINNCVQDNPRITLNIQLLNWSAITPSFVANGIKVSVSKWAAVWSTHGLLKAWESFLIHCTHFKVFTLFQILAFQRTTDNVDKVFELSNSKVNSVIHHFTKGLESFCRYIEQ